MRIDFLVVGHVVQDLLDSSAWQLGGAASYASLLARNLGLRSAVLTACSADFEIESLLPGIEVRRIESEQTTQMRNVYHPDRTPRREQWVPARGAVLTESDLPAECRDARIALLGPVAGEVPVSLARSFSSETLVGAGAQGWLRQVGPDSRVRAVPPEGWAAGAVLDSADVLFLSDEDLPAGQQDQRPAILDRWAKAVDCLAYTREYRGADIHCNGEWRHMDAFPANPVELTGAGDIFAAGFLIRLSESGDPWDATRFASAAASIVIEGKGVEGVPESREAIETRLKAYPEIVPA